MKTNGSNHQNSIEAQIVNRTLKKLTFLVAYTEVHQTQELYDRWAIV